MCSQLKWMGRRLGGVCAESASSSTHFLSTVCVYFCATDDHRGYVIAKCHADSELEKEPDMSLHREDQCALGPKERRAK